MWESPLVNITSPAMANHDGAASFVTPEKSVTPMRGRFSQSSAFNYGNSALLPTDFTGTAQSVDSEQTGNGCSQETVAGFMLSAPGNYPSQKEEEEEVEVEVEGHGSSHKENISPTSEGHEERVKRELFDGHSSKPWFPPTNESWHFGEEGQEANGNGMATYESPSSTLTATLIMNTLPKTPVFGSVEKQGAEVAGEQSPFPSDVFVPETQAQFSGNKYSEHSQRAVAVTVNNIHIHMPSTNASSTALQWLSTLQQEAATSVIQSPAVRSRKELTPSLTSPLVAKRGSIGLLTSPESAGKAGEDRMVPRAHDPLAFEMSDEETPVGAGKLMGEFDQPQKYQENKDDKVKVTEEAAMENGRDRSHRQPFSSTKKEALASHNDQEKDKDRDKEITMMRTRGRAKRKLLLEDGSRGSSRLRESETPPSKVRSLPGSGNRTTQSEKESEKESEKGKEKEKEKESAAFEGMAFVITGVDDGEEKQRLAQVVCAHGGTLLKEIAALQFQAATKKYQSVFVVSDRAVRTVKYLVALSLGFPVLSSQWLRDCEKVVVNASSSTEKSKSPFRSPSSSSSTASASFQWPDWKKYLLPAGMDQDGGVVPQSAHISPQAWKMKRSGCLHGMRIALSDANDERVTITKAAGADLIPLSMASRRDIVVSETGESPIKKYKGTVVSWGWISQCIVEGKVVGPEDYILRGPKRARQ
jgi:hypothetical protein